MGTLSQILTTAFNASQTQVGGSSTTLRDYQHAAKIFRPNNNSFMPKSKNWFHIFFQVDPTALALVNADLGTSITNNRINWNPANLNILGVLAKTVKLPNFRFEVKKENQYNRWNLATTKISYEPIEISFWDDTIDVIRSFWYAYYQYNIQDARYSNFSAGQTQGLPVPNQWAQSSGNTSALYSPSSNWGENFGLDTIETNGTSLNRNTPFFDSIRVYQFNHEVDENGPSYSEYVLVNPVISSFDHDTVDFSTSDFMQNRMTIEYETVLYNSGYVDANEIASWDAVLASFFDTTPSPIATINPQLNQVNQLGSVLASSFNLGVEVTQRALNTGQATTSSVLAAAVGTAETVSVAAQTSSQSTTISVPTVVNGYGTSGQPPVVL